MNISMLVAVVYYAISTGGSAAQDAYKALGIVGVWIVIGVVWVLVNPKMRGTKLLDASSSQTGTRYAVAADTGPAVRPPGSGFVLALEAFLVAGHGSESTREGRRARCR